jgi:hypothetical protein
MCARAQSARRDGDTRDNDALLADEIGVVAARVDGDWRTPDLERAANAIVRDMCACDRAC